MFIIIRKARQSKKVTIEDETVTVGRVTEVSDEYLERLRSEFPDFEVEITNAPVDDENDNNKKEDETA